MGKKSTPTRPIYASLIEEAASPVAAKEDFDRLTRKDFWNDPDRWDGINDPRETMIWEVRRPDRIDVRGKEVDNNELRNMMAAEKLKMDAQAAAWQSQLQQSVQYEMMNRRGLNQYGNLFGGLFGY